MRKNNLITKESLPWIVAIFFHALGAYFSAGYHHPDEHFQIWEWANQFLGLSPDQHVLPWEYGAQIRQWFQPLLHAALMKFFILLHVYNPFTTALIARELYAGLNLVALYSLWKTLKLHFGEKMNAQVCAWVIATLWFFPYIHCRTSSENLSSIFLTFAFSMYYRRSPKIFWIGFLFGCAFLARYQIALGMVGLGIYLLVTERNQWSRHFTMLGGFILAVIMGVGLDRWGYGNWVFTPYGYFHVNLVQGIAASFSPFPWYQYILWVLELNPLVTIPLFIGVYGYVKKVKMDPIIAFMGSFILIHFFMTNKEYRFLFPILNFIPFIVAVGWNKFYPRLWALVNIPGIIASSFHVTAYTIWPLFAFHHHFDPRLGLEQRWLTNHGTFGTMYYKMPDSFQFKQFDYLDDLKVLYEKTPKPLWLLWDDHPENKTFDSILNYIEARCERREISLPYFIYQNREKFPIIKRLPYQAVYHCTGD